MNSNKYNSTFWLNTRVFLTHSVIGIVIFYFLIHPFTMVIYWVELNKPNITIATFFDAIFNKIGAAFSLEKAGMSGAFIVLGALCGLGSGIYYKNIIRKNKQILQQEGLIKRDILSIIKNGENDMMELKASLRYDFNKKEINRNLEEVIVKTIGGFMNTNGGRLFIGVSDKGEILGLKNDYLSLMKKDKDGFELKLFQLISNSIGPEYCSSIHAYFYEIEGNEICVLDISKSTEPVYVSYKQNITFYIRTGNSTQPLSVKEAVNYISNTKAETSGLNIFKS
ncbi:MAG: ATP-binding protein [Bacteroidetes bacterium]|nr:MAG: ATP-binding protein [Bacteroidota bacterium]